MVSSRLSSFTALFLLVLPLCVNVLTARSQGQRPLTVSVSPASVGPGDVVRIDVSGTADELITATVFGQDLVFAFDDRHGTWIALAGVDLETAPETYHLRIQRGGTPVTTREIRIVPRRFRTRRLRVSDSFVNPPPEALEQIALDTKRLADAYAQSTPIQWTGAFILPVDGPPTSNFGTRSYYNGQPRAPHAGVDFMSEPGTPIRATNHGRIALAAPLYFTGTTVIVDHGGRLFSVFAHLSEVLVKAGGLVTPDTIIGLVGATGRVTGPHLHWSVRLSGARVDPLSLLAATQVSAPPQPP